MIYDAHEGFKAAVAKVFHTTWQHCRVHFMRIAMAHVGKGQRSMVAALLRTVFAQDSRVECHQQWRLVADQLREKYPKIAVLMAAARMKYWLTWPSRRRTASSYTAPTRWSG